MPPDFQCRRMFHLLRLVRYRVLGNNAKRVQAKRLMYYD
jgi:hypothetical protein